jgi:hypothetical protein
MSGLEGPYRDAHLSDLGFNQQYALVRQAPAKTEWKKRARRFILGRPFRQQQFNETLFEYRVAVFSHFFEQRWRALVALFCVLLLNILVYMAMALSDGSAGLVIATPPPSPYSAETTDARRALQWPIEAAVYAMPCSRQSNVTRRLQPAALVDLVRLSSDPRHASVADVALAERAGRKLLSTTTASLTTCACAPLLGYALRLLLVLNDSGSTETLYNPRLQLAASADLHVLRHTQAAWFNVQNASFVDGTSDVVLVRSAWINVEHSRADGETQVRRYQAAKAYCVAECLELLDGRTIWHTALEQAAAGVEVNAAHLPAIRARFACLSKSIH